MWQALRPSKGARACPCQVLHTPSTLSYASPHHHHRRHHHHLHYLHRHSHQLHQQSGQQKLRTARPGPSELLGYALLLLAEDTFAERPMPPAPPCSPQGPIPTPRADVPEQRQLMHCLDRAPEPFCKRLPPRTLVQGLRVRVRMRDSACVRKRLCVSVPARMHAKHVVGARLFLSISLLCLCLCLCLCLSLCVCL